MAAPVLVKAYDSDTTTLKRSVTGARASKALPPVSSYTFAAILRSSDGPEFQQAINGIAEICAKNRMSLADEYASHLPPLGEITASDSAAVRPHMLRPGARRALTSVPEASSGSSEGSRKSKGSKGKKRMGGLFGFMRKEQSQSQSMRQMRIGSMGRTVSVTGTTAMVNHTRLSEEIDAQKPSLEVAATNARPLASSRPSQAASSLQQLLAQSRHNCEPAEG